MLLLLATFVSTMVVGARMQFNFLTPKPTFSLNDDTLSLFPVEWVRTTLKVNAAAFPFL